MPATASPAWVRRLMHWYSQAARPLPWRAADVTPWGVMVSEFMLQQTQVARVLPKWREWMERWPTPAALAAAPTAEVIRAWGRLGYPRRAVRLQRAAATIAQQHGGRVPHDVEALLALPGVGDYTARAVAVFAYGKRHPVVDTNVRRVVARVMTGAALPGPARASDLGRVEALLPHADATARIASYALMEFGALVCTAAAPRCDLCPIRTDCAWAALGFPEHKGPRPSRQPAYEGSDRQARGEILRLLRESADAVAPDLLIAALPRREQAERALASLERDGLVARVGGGITLP